LLKSFSDSAPIRTGTIAGCSGWNITRFQDVTPGTLMCQIVQGIMDEERVG